MVMLIRGSELSPRLQQQAKACFVHRFTGEHRPQWTTQPRPDGSTYELQFKDDADWLAHTFFPVTKAGELSNRERYCSSTPTWPNRAGADPSPKEGSATAA